MAQSGAVKMFPAMRTAKSVASFDEFVLAVHNMARFADMVIEGSGRVFLTGAPGVTASSLLRSFLDQMVTLWRYTATFRGHLDLFLQFATRVLHRLAVDKAVDWSGLEVTFARDLLHFKHQAEIRDSSCPPAGTTGGGQPGAGQPGGGLPHPLPSAIVKPKNAYDAVIRYRTVRDSAGRPYCCNALFGKCTLTVTNNCCDKNGVKYSHNCVRCGNQHAFKGDGSCPNPIR